MYKSNFDKIFGYFDSKCNWGNKHQTCSYKGSTVPL